VGLGPGRLKPKAIKLVHFVFAAPSLNKQQ